ncbi:MAG: hypothetical protein R6W81_04685 [Bacteroidales bacterium]
MQILLFCLIPVGIILLILSIRLVNKTFSGNILLEIPYARKTAEFSLPRAGTYSIWHKGESFRKAPLDEFKPVIIDKSTSEEMKLSSLLLRLNSNNRKTARMELFRFSAPAGNYIIALTEGSSITGLENSIIGLTPFKMADPDKYFIQVRESQPLLITLAGIVMIVLAGFCILGGLILGILADQIFVN